jgi:hypothetical protein
MAEMRKEQQIIQQKATKLRQRISARNQNLTSILASVGLPANSDSVPSLVLLRQTLAKLETRKQEAESNLSAILTGDAFCLARELEADLITAYEESRRLRECLEEVQEYDEILCGDFVAARDRLRSDGFPIDVKSIKQDIASMERDLNEIRGRRDLSGDCDLTTEQIRNRIAQLTSTLSAERCSTATAVDLEQRSASQLRNLERGALTRLEQAMRLQVLEI